MQLRTKLTLFSVALIILAVGVCCALVLRFAKKRAINDMTVSALHDINTFCKSFSYTTKDDIPNDLPVLRSYLINRFRSISGFSEFTLHNGDEYLCNNTGFDVDTLLSAVQTQTKDDSIHYAALRMGGTDCFVANRIVYFGGINYSITLVRDISGISESIRELAIQCVIASAIVMLLAAAAMWLLVYRSLKPIEKLKAGAAELACGNYTKRIVMDGKNELAELAADFNGMADAIETTIGEINEKSERQQTFINDLSHELKTPITSILLCSETLLNRKVPPEMLNRSLERIYDQGKWLETLSQKLMMLVMLQGEIAMQPESVPALLDAVKEATIDALHEQGMELITDCSMDALPMDFDLLRSALTNLVVNARKASSDGQTIEIHAHGQTIAVVDHGRGIPQDEIARVTEPFYMLDRSRNKKLGGTGLGLALVKRIAEAHGATLSIESTLGQGTTVRLTFQSAK